jgi:IclR family mhp operon transcriptional activator
MSALTLTDSTYRHCQSLVKGLDLLTELNRSLNATASITDLARATGQHRTTVKRLLETLKEAGYVDHDVATNLYRLTFRVQQLSFGYRDITRVTEVAWPLMREFSKKMVWPCSLLAPEGDEMVVRVSTRAYSQLSFHPGMPGRRMPILTTSAGRAYMAFASEETRATLLEMLRSRPGPHDMLVHDRTFIDSLIEQTCARGYGSNVGEWSEEPKFSAYAVPIRHNGHALVSLNVIFLTRALKEPGVKEALLEALFTTAQEIEAAYAALQTDDDDVRVGN